MGGVPVPVRSSQAGMTLIEVMAVVLIIGLMSSLAILTIPSRDTPAQDVTKTLQRTLQSVQEEAILLGRPIGLDITEEGAVTVRVYEGGTWVHKRNVPGIERGNVTVRRTGLDLRAIEEDTRQTPRRFGRREVNAKTQTPPPGFISDPTGVSMTALYIIEDNQERYELEVADTGAVLVRAR